jgi:anthranilate/para-aminobenzoate synthase component II
MSIPEVRGRCLIIDNGDTSTSFLAHLLNLLGVESTVVHHENLNKSLFPSIELDRLIIAPEPFNPLAISTASRDAIKYFTGRVPVLCVCTTLDIVLDVFGGISQWVFKSFHSGCMILTLRHSQNSIDLGNQHPIGLHDGRFIFKGMANSFSLPSYPTRFMHIEKLSDKLEICSTIQGGGALALRHKRHTFHGIQFHHAMYLSDTAANTLLGNFIGLVGGSWEDESTPEATPLVAPFAMPETAPLPSDVPISMHMVRRITMARIREVMKVPADSFEYLAAAEENKYHEDSVPLFSRFIWQPEIDATFLPEIKHVDPMGSFIFLACPAGAQAAFLRRPAFSCTKPFCAIHANCIVHALCVITDPVWHRGSMTDLRLAREELQYLENRPAVMMKDFIVHEQQILSAKAHKADVVLLMASLLTEEELKHLYDYTSSVGMESFVEVNSFEEMKMVLRLDVNIIGLNARNDDLKEGKLAEMEELIGKAKSKGTIICRNWIGLSTVLE